MHPVRIAGGVALAAMAIGSAIGQGATKQPLGEIEIVRQFEQEAPALFAQWVNERPRLQEKSKLGQWNDVAGGTGWHCEPRTSFSFDECRDVEPPTKYKINVRKTDSILTPYVGEIFIDVKVACHVRRLFPEGFTFSLERFREAAASLAPQCIGKAYEECASARTKPREKYCFFGCSGAEMNFTYDHEVHLTYQWSHEKWEFQEASEKRSSEAASAR